MEIKIGDRVRVKKIEGGKQIIPLDNNFIIVNILFNTAKVKHVRELYVTIYTLNELEIIKRGEQNDRTIV